MTTRIPTPSDEYIDSRDVIAAIESLREDRDDDSEAFTKGDELAALEALASEGEGAPDWEYGETLIRADAFIGYAQELAEDIGAINRDASWPNNCIDWERAADELRMDYFTVDFAGVDFLVRA